MELFKKTAKKYIEKQGQVKCCGLTLFGCEHEEYDNIDKDEIQAIVDLWNTRTPKERDGEK